MKNKIKEPKSYSEEKNNQPKVEIISETELPETKMMVPVKGFAMPLANVDQIKEASKKYQEFLNALLTEKDVVKIKDKKTGEEKLVGKKVAFGKIARFWGVSTEVLRSFFEEHECKNDVCVWAYYGGRSVPKIKRGDKYLIAKAWIKAILPNGQFAVRGAAVSESERNFAHIPHDLIATAETRAAKRAIEAVIGMGEIELAEEDNGEKTENPPKEPTKQGEEAITTEQIATIQELAGDNLPKLKQFIEEKYGAKTWLDLTRKQGIALLKGLHNKKYEKSPENLPKDAGEMVGEENTGQ